MIRRTANISLSRARIFIPLGPIEEESARPSGWRGWLRANLLAWNPSRRGRPCRPDTHMRRRAVSIRDVRSAGLYVEIREKQSVPFTGNVYMDRLRILSRREPGLSARQAFHVCGWMPARESIRRKRYVTGYVGGYPCCGFRARVLSSPMYRILRVFDTRTVSLAMLRPATPLNRKAAY